MPYERLTAWRTCHQLVLEVHASTKAFPAHELYGLRSQIRRAAFSETANIAEGSAKKYHHLDDLRNQAGKLT